ncbi:MAG: ATP-binding protein [Acidobacteriota bacterium]
MTTEGNNPISEREQTDESLRTEREKADARQAEKDAIRERDADRVIHKARREADEVLVAARDRADEQLETSGLPSEAAAAISDLSAERIVEDAALRIERARADEVLSRERRQRARVLAVLRLEREKTNLDLLTERARSDDALSHRDDFLGIVSHDLRNLLNGIVLGAALLKSEAREGDEGNRIRENTDRIQRYAARMDRLIEDLGDVVSIDAGKLAMTAHREDCAVLIDEAIDTFRAVASEKKIALSTEIDERPLMAQFDASRMLQVLANLITNSIKFSHPGGSISVRVERRGEEAWFCVRDNGSGIPSNLLEAVFERFWQMGKNDRRGLGLGLYISRCIVEAHGGRIWAESEEGRGSEFRFTIPLGRSDRTSPSS